MNKFFIWAMGIDQQGNYFTEREVYPAGYESAEAAIAQAQKMLSPGGISGLGLTNYCHVEVYGVNDDGTPFTWRRMSEDHFQKMKAGIDKVRDEARPTDDGELIWCGDDEGLAELLDMTDDLG